MHKKRINSFVQFFLLSLAVEKFAWREVMEDDQSQFSCFDFLKFSGSICRAQFLFNFGFLVVTQSLVALGCGFLDKTVLRDSTVLFHVLYAFGMIAFLSLGLIMHFYNFSKRARDIYGEGTHSCMLAIAAFVPFLNLIVWGYLAVAPAKPKPILNKEVLK